MRRAHKVFLADLFSRPRPAFDALSHPSSTLNHHHRHSMHPDVEKKDFLRQVDVHFLASSSPASSKQRSSSHLLLLLLAFSLSLLFTLLQLFNLSPSLPDLFSDSTGTVFKHDQVSLRPTVLSFVPPRRKGRAQPFRSLTSSSSLHSWP